MSPDRRPEVHIRQDARRIAGVLGRRGLAEGRYFEEPDAMTWLAMANDVADAIAKGRGPAGVLLDTGYWSDDDAHFPDSLRQNLIAAAR